MAGLTTTQTFSDGDTVTAAKLNNIVSNASIDANAVTTAKILDANVTLAKMATLSVDTGQLVNDAVQNSKLNDMAAKTVKANATNGAANPTDVPVAANKLLVGTSDSINAVGFTTDLELDASDSAAADIRVADTLISGKSTATVVPANDTVLVYDADGSGTSKLRKTTVTSMMQTLPATNDTSGVSRIASVKRSVAPTPANGVDNADALGAINAGPMIAKAWIEFTSPGGVTSITNSFNITSLTRNSEGVFSIVFGNGGTDTKFDLPSDKYIVIATGYGQSTGTYTSDLLFGRITSKTAAGCTITFGSFQNVLTNIEDPAGATLVFYGLTS
jgi:hypothetical protein|tara:strand:+ start:810 stop:1802 length:993 start_codon:yes stop_codon:yes gene_type:complete